MDNDTLMFVVILAAVIQIILIVLFVRLCSNVKAIKKILIVAFDVEECSETLTPEFRRKVPVETAAVSH